MAGSYSLTTPRNLQSCSMRKMCNLSTRGALLPGIGQIVRLAVQRRCTGDLVGHELRLLKRRAEFAK